MTYCSVSLLLHGVRRRSSSPRPPSFSLFLPATNPTKPPPLPELPHLSSSWQAPATTLNTVTFSSSGRSTQIIHPYPSPSPAIMAANTSPTIVLSCSSDPSPSSSLSCAGNTPPPLETINPAADQSDHHLLHVSRRLPPPRTNTISPVYLVSVLKTKRRPVTTSATTSGLVASNNPNLAVPVCLPVSKLAQTMTR
jgi:hypothetical protein